MAKARMAVAACFNPDELAVKQKELESEMQKELEEIEGKYWDTVYETDLLLNEPDSTLEEYQAMWNEKVVPHRKLRNNIYRKYRRRFAKYANNAEQRDVPRAQ